MTMRKSKITHLTGLIRGDYGLSQLISTLDLVVELYLVKTMMGVCS
jgi:hypothetical protein